MSKTHLSALQMAIMRVLWQRGEATVAEVHGAITPQRDLAHNTVATVLSRLAKQGVIAHRKDGRQYIYRALIPEHEVRRSMVGSLVDRLFQGDAAALVSHLVHENEIGPDDLERLRTLLDAHGADDENA